VGGGEKQTTKVWKRLWTPRQCDLNRQLFRTAAKFDLEPLQIMVQGPNIWCTIMHFMLQRHLTPYECHNQWATQTQPPSHQHLWRYLNSAIAFSPMSLRHILFEFFLLKLKVPDPCVSNQYFYQLLNCASCASGNLSNFDIICRAEWATDAILFRT